MKYERHIACQLLDRIQSLKAESLPVCRIFSVDVADSCCKEVNSKISDHLTFVRVCAFAFSYNAVFFSADGSYFCLDGHVVLMCDLHKFFCLLHIFFDRIMGTVKHNGGKSCFHTFQTSFVAAVI